MDDLSRAVEGVFQRAAAANAPKEGDYIGDDGLLYCGVCNTPKQCLLELYGKPRKMPCACNCKKGSVMKVLQFYKQYSIVSASKY